MLVAAVDGVLEAVARERPVGRGQGLAGGDTAPGEVADRLGDDADLPALLVDEGAVTTAPCPGTTTPSGASSPMTMSRVSGHSMGYESAP